MDQRQLAHRILRAFFEGRVGQKEFLRFLSEHMVPVCSLETESLWTDEAVSTTLSEDRLASLILEAERLPALHRQARQQAKELLAVPEEQRSSKLEALVGGAGSPLLVGRLLTESRKLLTNDPQEALAVAQLAERVAERLSVDAFGEELVQSSYMRARAHRANSLRVQGCLKPAEEIFQNLLGPVEDLPDPLLRAELWSFVASLYRDQRRYEEAEALVDQAMDAYRQAGDNRDLGRLLLQKASLIYASGRPTEAGRTCRQALEYLTQESARSWLVAHHNVAFYLSEEGEYTEARDWVKTHRQILDATGEPLIQWRQSWLEGRIAQGLGEAYRAEEFFLRARQGFVDAGLAYDAALVSLDLAVLMTRQGRSAEVRQLAEEMLPIFHSQEIHREAFAAYLLFRQAAQAERVTVGLLNEVSSLLRRSAEHRRPQEKPS